MLKVNLIFLLQVASYVSLLKLFTTFFLLITTFLLLDKSTNIIPDHLIRILIHFLELIFEIFSILYQGPKVYNSLNTEICNSCSFCIFKSKLKSVLLSSNVD